MDCRLVNVSIDTPSFSQEGLKAVAELIEPGDRLILLDIQDGFHHVSICSEHQTYFGIKWKGNFYVWTSLCFGISCTPYFFYKVLRLVVSFLHENNICLANFVDDFLVMLKEMYIVDHTDFIVQTFKDLGWSLNFEKCDLILSTQKTFVGFHISTDGLEGPWIIVLPQKIHKLRRAIKSCLLKNNINARGLARTTGQCISMTKAILPAKLILRNCYRVLASRLGVSLASGWVGLWLRLVLVGKYHSVNTTPWMLQLTLRVFPQKGANYS